MASFLACFADEFHNEIKEQKTLKNSSTYKDLIKKGISHSCLYGDVNNKANKFQCDKSILVKYLKNLIGKNSLRQL